MSFITTNYYLTATYADKVRQHMKQSAVVSTLINFERVKLFQSAQGQHNAITSLLKKQDDTLEAKIAVTKREGHLDGETLNRILFWNDEQTAYGTISNRRLFDGPRNYIRLITTGSRTDNSVQLTLSRIENGGSPLLTVAEIAQGIVTGANQASERQIAEYKLDALPGEGIFVLSTEETKRLGLAHRERDFIKPWFKNSDIQRWTTSRTTDKRLIYIRADSEFGHSEIPHLLAHFKRFKALLVNRNVRTGKITIKQYDDFVRGRGDVPYVMIKSAFASGRYYCVSYARDEYVFSGEKIVCPQFSPLNTFAFDDREWFAASDVYFIKEKRGGFRLKYLLGLLNSKLCYFWLYHKGQRKGELLQLFKGPLAEIPIAKALEEQQRAMELLVGRIVAAKACDATADTSELEKEIDHLVYHLYGLTPEEIATVEESSHQ